jgi:hypothetical protein
MPLPSPDLERRLLQGLACEWEKALWVLPRSQREKMIPPLFHLGDFQDRWGSWRRDKREIALSLNLVLNHSWDAVREVLLHETAHQFADEVLGAFLESPHGPQFQRACQLLRANPRASGSYPLLEERLKGEEARPADKNLLRVRKLMALAASPNLHEAEAAMAKAQALMKKYNLRVLEEGSSSFETVSLGRPALRHPEEEYALAHLLQEFYFVQGIWVSAFVLEKGKMGRVLEISGTLPNLRVAGYVHDFVSRFIQSRWRDYNGKKNLNLRRRTDFALGVIEGFRSKLRSGNETGDKSAALLRLENPRLEKFMAYKYPRTARIAGGRIRPDRQILEDGRKAGRTLVIAKGIETGTRNRKLQIAAG